MKVPTKPISSPGRTDKFQPPLMLKFLRTNVGSKSGRSSSKPRASPMFIRKKNTVIETNQEPSSPKVSCIGQVRARRKHHHRRSRRHCWRVRKALFFKNWKFKRPRLLRGLNSVLRKWVLFIRCGYCKRVDVKEDSYRETTATATTAVEYENRGDKIEEAKEEIVAISPPKNAFLLTRCRSAPFRSNSLASRFWETPLKTGEEEEETEEVEEEEEEKEEKVGPTFCSSTSSSRIEEECRGSLGILQGRNSEGCCRNVEEDGKPLILTRCKSEPARTGEKLIIATIKL